MSLQAAGQKAGISDDSWSGYEQGKPMREDIAYKIAAAFGVELGQVGEAKGDGVAIARRIQGARLSASPLIRRAVDKVGSEAGGSE